MTQGAAIARLFRHNESGRVAKVKQRTDIGVEIDGLAGIADKLVVRGTARVFALTAAARPGAIGERADFAHRAAVVGIRLQVERSAYSVDDVEA